MNLLPLDIIVYKIPGYMYLCDKYKYFNIYLKVDENNKYGITVRILKILILFIILAINIIFFKYYQDCPQIY